MRPKLSTNHYRGSIDSWRGEDLPRVFVLLRSNNQVLVAKNPRPATRRRRHHAALRPYSAGAPGSPGSRTIGILHHRRVRRRSACVLRKSRSSACCVSRRPERRVPAFAGSRYRCADLGGTRRPLNTAPPASVSETPDHARQADRPPSGACVSATALARRQVTAGQNKSESRLLGQGCGSLINASNSTDQAISIFGM